MKALAIVTSILCMLAVPALIILVGTARAYLATTADIAAIRVDIAELRPVLDTTRTFPGPDITLRVSGVARTSLTLQEVNFDLLWQGQRVATVAAFPKLAIPRNGSLLTTIPSNLDPAHEAESRALLAGGERRFQIEGNVRIGLPNSDASVWLTLRGQIRAAMPAGTDAARAPAISIRHSSFVIRHSSGA